MRLAFTALLALAVCFLSAPGVLAAEGMHACPNCGLDMPLSFNFCSNCGTNLETGPRVNAEGDATTTTTTGTMEAGHGTTTTHATTVTKKKTFQFSDLLGGSGHHESALSDKPTPLATVPDRPKPIIEWGQNPFLGRGPIASGIVMPTGAVWQPVFIVFGTSRIALQTFDNGLGQISEVVGRVDLYGNLYLTPTERILIGFRPLDRDGLDYTGYQFEPGQEIHREINAYVTTLFFQGDFGELFPRLDPGDTKRLDIGFAVGRQPLSFQDGIMINEDEIDAIGITRVSNFFLGSSAWRTTGVFAWNELNRNNNRRDSSAKLLGLFNSADYARFTIDLDVAYVSAEGDTGGDGLYGGVGIVQRLGLVNSTTRINASWALEEETPAISNGVLLFQQFAITMPASKDFAYLDLFWAIDNYSSAARSEDRGGPLAQVGILFAPPGMGNYGSPLSNRANDAVGGAIGYQMFFDGADKQFIFEVGGRVKTKTPEFFAASQPNSIAAAARYQMKLNQHSVLIFDAFVGAPEDRSTAYGFRSEVLFKF